MEMEKKKEKSDFHPQLLYFYQSRKKCKGMRESWSCHSRWLKKNKRIDLRVNREISNDAKKMLKGNVLVSGTMETDLNSEVLFRGLKRGITGKTSS